MLARPFAGTSNIGAPVTHLREQVRKHAFGTAHAGVAVFFRHVFLIFIEYADLTSRRDVRFLREGIDSRNGYSGACGVKATELCVVRHGRTDWNDQRRAQGRADIPLNARGREQARRCAAHLALAGPWDAVVCSPLSRACETADIIARATGVSAISVLDALVERDCGMRGGWTPEEALARGISDQPEDAESDEAIRTRARAALVAVADAYVGRRVLVVSHGGWIRAALEALLGVADARAKSVLDNTGLCRLSHRAGVWEVHSVNERSHLDHAD